MEEKPSLSMSNIVHHTHIGLPLQSFSNGKGYNAISSTSSTDKSFLNPFTLNNKYAPPEDEVKKICAWGKRQIGCKKKKAKK